MYTLQLDRFNNPIVCKGSEVRNGYRVLFYGGYKDCLRMKLDYVKGDDDE